jgi:hypothetical protein
MVTLDDLPASALQLITRFARRRFISGTNRFARVCRSWRDAGIDSDNDEQLQLLIALEGLPPGAVASTSTWLAQHGSCVTSLEASYDTATAPLFQQLPLSTAPLVGLARLEVDGPGSLVALAPALPQLVALTHLRASIGLTRHAGQGVFSAEGVPLEAVPSLQQLCPGLKSLRLIIDYQRRTGERRAWVPIAQLLPGHLEQLHIEGRRRSGAVLGAVLRVSCTTLTSLTSLRHLTLEYVHPRHPDLLLHLPRLAHLDLSWVHGWTTTDADPEHRLKVAVCTAPHHLTSLFEASPGNGSVSLQSLFAPVTNLCKLEVLAWYMTPEGPWMQRLPDLSSVRHLSVYVGARDPDIMFVTPELEEAAVMALSSLRQLTCLHLRTDMVLVQPTTWAAVLDPLDQLRVLVVTKEQLLEGSLAAELPRLPQLQCLYVEDIRSGGEWDPAAMGAAVVPHLPVLSQCNSLRAVLCWPFLRGNAEQPLWAHVHQGNLHLSCWGRWRSAAEEGRVVCPRPCPHLPGVWELQQEADDGLQAN